MARGNDGQRGAGRITLTEVAQLAGVSRSAASFALNGRTDLRISEETSERVRRAAEKLGYSPNATAKTLRTGTSGTVALVSDFVGTTSVANSMVRGALQALRDAGTLLYTVDTEGDPDLEVKFLQNLRSRDIDGFLYASMFTRSVAPPALVQQAPFVMLNCMPEGADAVAVVPDEFAAGRTAAEVLLNAGHSDEIWFVGAFPTGFTGAAAWHGWNPLALDERLAGIAAALADVGTVLAGSAPIDDDWDIPNGRESVARLLAAEARPSALICANDAVAVGAYHALQQAGLRVPDDVSVISFDGSLLTVAVVPTLTSVALPHEELGRLAAQLLIDGASTPAVHRVPMPLSLGASVAPPASKR